MAETAVRPEMETVIRIKRKRNEDPLDALLVHSDKKLKHHVFKWVESVDQQSIEQVMDVHVAFSCQTFEEEGPETSCTITGREKGSPFLTEAKKGSGRSIQSGQRAKTH
jgi:hypothetical protein